jgi:hypothetical protein
MIQALGVAPTTFIPPWNAGDTNTLKAAALGCTLYSTSTANFNTGLANLGGITVQGESTGFGWGDDSAWQPGMQSLTQTTDAALNNMASGGSYVVGYHFWAFENPDGSPNPARIALFKQYIDHLKGRGDVGFTTLGGQQLLKPSPSPAVCSPDGSSLDVFAEGTYHALWHKHYQPGSGWSAWEYLGGYLTSSPAATSPANGTIDVFARGTDAALYSKQLSGGVWGPWNKIGGQLLAGTGPAAYNWGSTQTGWFVTGTNHALYYMWKDSAGVHGWEYLGGYLTSSPAAASRSSGTIDVFARGTDAALYTKQLSGGVWNKSWTPFGGQVASGTSPAACAQGPNSIEVSVQGTDHALWHMSSQGPVWSAWASLGGVLTSSPALTSPASGTIDVFARGSDNGLWERSYNNSWYAWTSIGNIWS